MWGPRNHDLNLYGSCERDLKKDGLWKIRVNLFYSGKEGNRDYHGATVALPWRRYTVVVSAQFRCINDDLLDVSGDRHHFHSRACVATPKSRRQK